MVSAGLDFSTLDALRRHHPAWRLLRACWVFHLVCFAWICFRAETFADAGALLRQLGDWRRPELATLPAALTIVLGLATQLCDGDRLAPLWDWINRRSFVLQGLLAAIILTIVMGLGPRGVAPFIYFQF